MVVLIVGVLAAVALPSFFSQSGKASDARAKGAAHSAVVAMETCRKSIPGSPARQLSKPVASVKRNTRSSCNRPRPRTPFTIKRSAKGEVTFTCNKKKEKMAAPNPGIGARGQPTPPAYVAGRQ